MLASPSSEVRYELSEITGDRSEPSSGGPGTSGAGVAGAFGVLFTKAWCCGPGAGSLQKHRFFQVLQIRDVFDVPLACLSLDLGWVQTPIVYTPVSVSRGVCFLGSSMFFHFRNWI